MMPVWFGWERADQTRVSRRRRVSKSNPVAERAGSMAGNSDGFPELLTQEEAIRLLRLDSLDLKQPKEALRYLRRTGQIAYLKVCGKVLFPRKALNDYISRNLVEVRRTPLD